MTRARPTFLLLGAGRSGTTGVAQGLATHPQVFVTAPKEPHYLALHDRPAHFTGPGDDITINKVAVTDRAAYLDLYPEEPTAYTALGDASVSSLYYADRAIPEIQRICPDARMVIMLREPVARAQSAFGYMSVRGFEPCADLVEALADEDRRVAANWHHLWHYERMSLYAPSVKAYLDTFGPDQVRIWYYDDLERDYVGTVTSILRFIGTEESPGEASGVPRVNASGTPRSPAAQKVIQLLTSQPRARSTIKRLTSYRLREAVRSRLLRRAEVRDQVMEAVAGRFTDDLRALAELVPMDTAPEWLRNPR